MFLGNMQTLLLETACFYHMVRYAQCNIPIMAIKVTTQMVTPLKSLYTYNFRDRLLAPGEIIWQ